MGEFKPADFSDAGNAELLATAYRGLVSWCDALGWLYFNGQGWEQDEHDVTNAAIALTDSMLDDARAEYRDAVHREADAKAYVADGVESAAEELEKAKRAVKAAAGYLDHAKKSRNVARVKGMLELAKPSLVVRADKLDADPFLLNTPGGIVDLRTGAVKPHDIGSPYLFCTKITTATPEEDPDGALIWTEFLQTITCGDYSLVAFLQMVVGMAAIGHIYHEGIIICNGGGRNGKSTFWNTIQTVMGDYTGSIDPDVLTTDKQRRGATLATLRGRRMVIAAETEEHQRLSTSTLKRLASTDKLSIERKYHDPEDITPSHTLVLFTNFLPKVGSTDNGTWRRLTVVPFNAVIPVDSGKQNYADYLVEHAGRYIMAWIVDGAKMFIENGYRLPQCEAVMEATEAYRDRENWLERFIDECCVREPGSKVGARALYTCFKDWAQDTGEFVRRESDFSDVMIKAGYRKNRSKSGFFYHGVRLGNSSAAGNRWGATG